MAPGAPQFYSGDSQTLSTILSLAKSYAQGYYACTLSDYYSTAEVALTTNTSLTDSSAAGAAWASMVNSFATYLSNYPPGAQVLAAGGNDIEPNFSTPTDARNWVGGYAGNYTRRLINFGSADGCSVTAPDTSTSCGAGDFPSWGPEDIFYVSWGAAPAWPFPQIYRTDSVQAEQWYYLSLYFVSHNDTPMTYLGSATQYRSCQHRSCTSDLKNTVSAGYNQLVTQLARSSSTKQTPAHATDWEWDGDEL